MPPLVFGEEAANSGAKTVEAIDATTVKITMRAANTSFLKNLPWPSRLSDCFPEGH